MKEDFIEDDFNEYDDYEFDSNDRVVLDDPENLDIELDDVDFEDELDNETIDVPRKGTLISVLTNEVKQPEYTRGVLDFKYKGEEYQGVPMVKMSDDRFLFKLISHGDKLKAFKLSEIRVS